MRRKMAFFSRGRALSDLLQGFKIALSMIMQAQISPTMAEILPSHPLCSHTKSNLFGAFTTAASSAGTKLSNAKYAVN
jgi:hypothetical protein